MGTTAGSAARTIPPLTIGALAKGAGVGVETIRFYEREGLLARPARPAGGYRKYPASAVERIRFIRHAQALGFSLEDVASLLSLKVTAGSSCAAVRGKAAAKLADVEDRIANLQQIRAALETLVAACPGRGALGSCTILQALEAAAPDTKLARRGPTRRAKGTAKMKSLEVKIEGMHCTGCAGTIQALLKHEAGVRSANVSFDKGTALVYYDPAETDPEKVKAAIERAGYRASGAGLSKP